MANLSRCKTIAIIVTTFLCASWLTPTFLCDSPVAAISCTSLEGQNTAATGTVDAATQRALAAFGKLPLHFVENQGQKSGVLRFSARTAGISFGIAPSEAVMHLHATDTPEIASPSALSSRARIASARQPNALPTSQKPWRKNASLRIQLVGANRHARVVGENELQARSNYFIGNDPGQWRTEVRNYTQVKVEEIYRGVDVVYYGSGQQLEYDFNVAPEASYRAIRLRFNGVKRLSIDGSGELALDTTSGVIRQRKPIAYQESNGIRREVPCRYAIQRGTVGFSVGEYDARRPLVIDPVLSYATLLGEATLAQGIAVDAGGNTYVTGTVISSAPFPTSPGAAQERAGDSGDAFITKFDPKGSRLIYSTYLGGSRSDVGTSIAVDRDGNAYVTGYTFSSNFPVTAGAFQTVKPGGALGECAFVVKLNPAGDAFTYTTYLGGNDMGDSTQLRVLGAGMSIAIDASGSAYVTGYTESGDFPTRNPLQANNLSAFCGYSNFTHFCAEAFVTKLNAAGTDLVYSTYLGGGGTDVGRGIAVDGAGNAYVVGDTSSSDFPLMNPLQAANHSSPCPGGSSLSLCNEAFVVKLNAAGNTLIYSTYLGGTGDDQANAIAVDVAGNAYITGSTNSSDFPITSAILQS